MQPAVSRLREAYGDRVIFERYDIDAGNNSKIKSKYRVSAIPVFVILNGFGEQLFKHTGGISYQTMKDDIEYALKQ
jgi:hypothetical protein